MYIHFELTSLLLGCSESCPESRVDFEGKLKRRRFKFLISFIKFKSFAARTFRTIQ